VDAKMQMGGLGSRAPMKIYLALAVSLILIIWTRSQTCTRIGNCNHGGNVCPNGTVSMSHLIIPTIYPFHQEFVQNMEKVVEILKKYPGVRTNHGKYTFHMTLHCIRTRFDNFDRFMLLPTGTPEQIG
jgi:hypothetical protein